MARLSTAPLRLIAPEAMTWLAVLTPEMPTLKMPALKVRSAGGERAGAGGIAGRDGRSNCGGDVAGSPRAGQMARAGDGDKDKLIGYIGIGQTFSMLSQYFKSLD